MNSQLPATPWYTSPVQVAQVTALVSTLCALFPAAAGLFGLTSPDAITHAVESIVGVAGLLITIGSAIVGIIKRKNSPIQPLTLTQAAADVHPATIASQTGFTPTSKGPSP